MAAGDLLKQVVPNLPAHGFKTGVGREGEDQQGVPDMLDGLVLGELQDRFQLTFRDQIRFGQQDHDLGRMPGHFQEELQVLLSEGLVRADGYERAADLGKPVHRDLRVVREDAPKTWGVHEPDSPVGRQCRQP